MDNKKKMLISSIICVVACMILYRITGKILRSFELNSYLRDFIKQLAFAIYCIIALLFLKKMDVLKVKAEGFMEGLIAGIAMIAFSSFILLSLVIGIASVTAKSSEIILFTLQMLLVGVAEEVAFRGILQNAVMDYIGYETVKKVRIGIIISGAVFGLIHLANGFLPGVSFTSAAMQAIGVVPIGVVLGTIYYRSGKNIWPVIILHAYNDFASFISSGALGSKTQNEVLNSKSSATWVAFVAWCIVAAYLMRRKKIEEKVNR